MPAESKQIVTPPTPTYLEFMQVASDAENSRLEKERQDFEILKILHAAGLQRWKDRRENEWKLNYAIWAAIAGMDALLLHDQSGILVDKPLLWAGGLACVALHTGYLWPTISRAIGEIQLQSDAEHAMKRLIADSSIRDEISDEHLGGKIRLHEVAKQGGREAKGGVRAWLWKRYGLFAPLCFTIALLVFGALLLRGYFKAAAKPGDKANVIQFINDAPSH